LLLGLASASASIGFVTSSSGSDGSGLGVVVLPPSCLLAGILPFLTRGVPLPEGVAGSDAVLATSSATTEGASVALAVVLPRDALGLKRAFRCGALDFATVRSGDAACALPLVLDRSTVVG